MLITLLQSVWKRSENKTVWIFVTRKEKSFSISIIWRKPSLLILAVPQLSKSFLATKEKRSENGLKKAKVKSDQHSKSFQTENGLNFVLQLEKWSEFFRPFFKVSKKVPWSFTPMSDHFEKSFTTLEHSEKVTISLDVLIN